MPLKASHRTDPPQVCQLIDLLKETGRLGKGIFYLPMTGEVSERINDRIKFAKGDWLIETQDIQDVRVMGRTVCMVKS